MFFIKTFVFIGIFSIYRSKASDNGTLTSDYGRISNMPDPRIHVAAALSLADCIRQCVDFRRNYHEYYEEDCFGYNYQIDQYTCELIHSINRMNYDISFQTRWITGFKS